MTPACGTPEAEVWVQGLEGMLPSQPSPADTKTRIFPPRAEKPSHYLNFRSAVSYEIPFRALCFGIRGTAWGLAVYVTTFLSHFSTLFENNEIENPPSPKNVTGQFMILILRLVIWNVQFEQLYASNRYFLKAIPSCITVHKCFGCKAKMCPSDQLVSCRVTSAREFLGADGPAFPAKVLSGFNSLPLFIIQFVGLWAPE